MLKHPINSLQITKRNCISEIVNHHTYWKFYYMYHSLSAMKNIETLYRGSRQLVIFNYHLNEGSIELRLLVHQKHLSTNKRRLHAGNNISLALAICQVHLATVAWRYITMKIWDKTIHVYYHLVIWFINILNLQCHIRNMTPWKCSILIWWCKRKWNVLAIERLLNVLKTIFSNR